MIVLVLHFVYICGFVCKWLHTRLIQSTKVLSECDYISLVDCCSISATTAIFHVLQQCGGLVLRWNTVYFLHHDQTLMAWLLIWYCLCSGMIACACDMSKWLVECECVCRQMDEWMVSGWNECDCVAWAPCNTGWKLNCYLLLWSISISVYTIIGMCERERPEREARERRWEQRVFG